MDDAGALWILARSVADVFVAGSQLPVTIEATGRTFDAERKVRVTKTEENDDGETWPIEWCGDIVDWNGALREALDRPAFPGAIEGWRPGEYESAARSA